MFRWIVIYLALHHVLLFSQNPDIELLRKLNLHRNKTFDKTFNYLTETHTICSFGSLVGITAYCLVNKDTLWKKHALNVGLSLLTAATITHTLKYAIHRERPYIAYPEIEKLSTGGNYSFPSGHTSEVFSAATSVSIEYPRWYVIVPLGLWASSVAYSRMHLGVHYPSDIVGGMITGVGCSFFAHWLTKKIRHKSRRNDTTNH